MSTRPATTNRHATAPRRATVPAAQRARTQQTRRAAKARRVARRRRIGALLMVLVLSGMVAAVVVPRLPDAVRELTLPLKHEDIIRQQAADKGVDESLIAGVIYHESRFRDQTSHAGARGLMQITQDTATYIARLSGGTSFQQGDLASPQINIAYGTFYLRYLLRRYGGNEVLSLAAYNAGPGRVDAWVGAHPGGPEGFAISDIPFPETRHYVANVLETKRDYRRSYAAELGY